MSMIGIISGVYALAGHRSYKYLGVSPLPRRQETREAQVRGRGPGNGDATHLKLEVQESEGYV